MSSAAFPRVEPSKLGLQAVGAILHVLDQVEQARDDAPPLPQASRFGNKAFCTFFTLLRERASAWHRTMLPPALEPAAVEASAYLEHAFGDPQRLDYGTGHELNFVCWLCALAKLGFLEATDYPALVLRVLARYLSIMRRLQREYLLEPAGSRGVWGLDDFHFLVFLFGSSQLVDHPRMTPKSARNMEVLEGFGNDYLYLGAIKFIMEVPFAAASSLSPSPPCLPFRHTRRCCR